MPVAGPRFCRTSNGCAIRQGLPILYVSHSLAEVARLANHVLALADGKVVGFGPTGAILADADAAAAFGGEEPGSLIEARHEGIETDGLSRLTFSGGGLLVPALPAHTIGLPLRLLVRARDVMVARTLTSGAERPEHPARPGRKSA